MWVALQGGKDNTLLSMDTLLASPLGSDSDPLPTRRVDIDLTPVSLVLGTPMMCYPNSPEEFQLLHGKTGRSHSTAVGQSFKGDVVAAVQPNIQSELQDTLVRLQRSLSSPVAFNAQSMHLWRSCEGCLLQRLLCLYCLR